MEQTVLLDLGPQVGADQEVEIPWPANGKSRPAKEARPGPSSAPAEDIIEDSAAVLIPVLAENRHPFYFFSQQPCLEYTNQH